MKYTSEMLMKAMGLNVGDRIRFEDEIYTIKYLNTEKNCYIYAVEEKEKEKLLIHYLVDLDYEILPRPKRVGDLKCGGLECQECPLRTIRCDKDNVDIEDCYLYYILESILVGAEFDQEIHDLLKARLDKEVVEEC